MFIIILYYAFIFPFLTYGIEFWGQATAYRLQPIRVVQTPCNRIIYKVDPRSHCLSLAKMLKLLMIDDLYNYCLLTLMFNIFLGDVCNAIKDIFVKLHAVHNFSNKESEHNFLFTSLHSFIYTIVYCV